MAGGRPTKYAPEMCEKVIELGKIGASRNEIALELDIHVDTLIEWEKEKPEFSEALKRSRRFSQGWWEKNGRVATFGGFEGFNATSFIFNMKNRFSDDWKDKQETEHSGSVDTVITVANEAKKKRVEEL